ncbi:MAG: hypothetical protein LBI49_04400 [Nocardiopsaceae bacterium]|jgi:hypothetical protein|nr:hypothetical protein [Nocardiopsaceae bacterium]
MGIRDSDLGILDGPGGPGGPSGPVGVAGNGHPGGGSAAARRSVIRRRSRTFGWLLVLTVAAVAVLMALSALGWPGGRLALRPSQPPAASPSPGQAGQETGGSARPHVGGTGSAPGTAPVVHRRLARTALPVPTLIGPPERGAGRLVVFPGVIDLGSGLAGDVTISAAGGPVRWSARSSSKEVRLGTRGGRLAVGRRAELRIQVWSDRAGSALIRISPGGIVVRVRWDGPDSPTMSSSPSPSWEPSPTDSPSPSPSESGSASSSPSSSQSGTGSPVPGGRR